MYDDIRDEMVEICRAAYDAGHVVSTFGNASVRTADNRGIIIKASGASFRTMEAEDLLLVDWKLGAYSADSLAPTTSRPSMELRFHLGLYKLSDKTNAVLHTHSPCTCALSLSARPEIPLVTPEAARQLKRVPIIDACPAGSEELADAVCDAFRGADVKCAVVKAHGPIAIGGSLLEAFDFIEMLEHSCKVATAAMAAGCL